MKRTTLAVGAAATMAAVAVIAYTALGATAEPATTSTSSVLTTAAGQGFYVNPASTPAQWVAKHPADGRTAEIKAGIAGQPIAAWFGDNYSASQIGPAVASYVGKAASAGKVPVLVSYNIPHRDACGVESAGGASAAATYRTWISSFAAGVAGRKAIVILEPDALADFTCLSAARATERESLLAFATQQFHDHAAATNVYLDAGNSHYASASAIAPRLVKSGLANAHGFSLNVSNFHPTAEESAFAGQVNAKLVAAGAAKKPYVVDSSRNGSGSNGQWCNPAGRKLGVTPRVESTTGTGLEAELWIKTPGASDGTCGAAPTVPAGTFAPQVAYELVRG